MFSNAACCKVTPPPPSSPRRLGISPAGFSPVSPTKTVVDSPDSLVPRGDITKPIISLDIPYRKYRFAIFTMDDLQFHELPKAIKNFKKLMTPGIKYVIKFSACDAINSNLNNELLSIPLEAPLSSILLSTPPNELVARTSTALKYTLPEILELLRAPIANESGLGSKTFHIRTIVDQSRAKALALRNVAHKLSPFKSFDELDPTPCYKNSKNDPLSCLTPEQRRLDSSILRLEAALYPSTDGNGGSKGMNGLGILRHYVVALRAAES